MMDNLKKLEYYRAETKHEFSLLGQRVSWYVTCQSFLIIAFSSGMSNPNVYFRLGIGLILPTLGIITSILIKPSIDGAITIINQWGAKEYEVLQNEDLKDFKIKRAYEKVSPKSHIKFEQKTDVIKRESLKFAKHIPIVFIYAWVSLFLLGVAVNMKL
jgi:hypothetical protein